MLEPYKGRIFDPCCGSGGMFVQSEKFIEAHGGKIGDISVFGQESNQTTWRLCKMNLAFQGIDANIEWGDSFRDDQFKDLRANFILANPPFNDSDWGGELLQDDIRWKKLLGLRTSSTIYRLLELRGLYWPTALCLLTLRARGKSARG